MFCKHALHCSASFDRDGDNFSVVNPLQTAQGLIFGNKTVLIFLLVLRVAGTTQTTCLVAFCRNPGPYQTNRVDGKRRAMLCWLVGRRKLRWTTERSHTCERGRMDESYTAPASHCRGSNVTRSKSFSIRSVHDFCNRSR